MAAPSLVVRILGDSKRFEGTMRKAGESMKKFEAHAKKIGVGALALGGAITALGFATVSAAQKEQIGIQKLDGALRNAGTSYAAMKGEIEALAESQQRLTNFGDNNTRDMLTRMIQLSGDAAASIKNLALAQDIASSLTKEGGDVQRKAKSVAEGLGRALNGDVEVLSSWGVKLQAGATQLEVYTALIKKFGGGAQDAADPLIQLRNRLGDLSEKIGNELLPYYTALLNKMEQVTRTVIGLADKYPKLTKVIVLGTAALGGFLMVLGTATLGIMALSMAVRQLGIAKAVLMKILHLLTAANIRATASRIAHTTATVISTVALKASAKAQWLLNVAMRAAPLGKLTMEIARTTAVVVAKTAVLVASRVAMLAAAVATGVWTVAQWLLNVALTANPVGLVIVGIGALIGVIAVAVKYWSQITAAVTRAWEWFWKLGKPIKLAAAALLILTGPIGLLIVGTVLLIRHWRTLWDAVPKSFGGAAKAVQKLFMSGFGWLLPGGLLARALAWLRGTLAGLWRRVASIWDSESGDLTVGIKQEGGVDAVAVAWKWATSPLTPWGGIIGGGIAAWKWATSPTTTWRSPILKVTVATWKWALASATAFAGAVAVVPVAAWKWAAAAVSPFAATISVTVAAWKWALASAVPFAGTVAGVIEAAWKWKTGTADKLVTLTASIVDLVSDPVKKLLRTLGVGPAIWGVGYTVTPIAMKIVTSITGFFADKWDDLMSFLGIGGSSNRRRRAVDTTPDPSVSLLTAIKNNTASTAGYVRTLATNLNLVIRALTLSPTPPTPPSRLTGKPAIDWTAAWKAANPSKTAANLLGTIAASAGAGAGSGLTATQEAYLKALVVYARAGAVVTATQEGYLKTIASKNFGSLSLATIARNIGHHQGHSATTLLFGIHEYTGLMVAYTRQYLRKIAEKVTEGANAITTALGQMTGFTGTPPKVTDPGVVDPGTTDPGVVDPGTTGGNGNGGNGGTPPVVKKPWGAWSAWVVYDTVIDGGVKWVYSDRHRRRTDGSDYEEEIKEDYYEQKSGKWVHFPATGASGSRGPRSVLPTRLLPPRGASASASAGAGAAGAIYNFNFEIKVQGGATPTGHPGMWNTFERDVRRILRKLQREGVLPLPAPS